MSVKGVEIKKGQVWRTRAGDEVVIASLIPGLRLSVQAQFKSGSTYCVYPNGQEFSHGEGHNDLMFLVSDPDVKVERRVRNTTNGPLRRRDDFPPIPDNVPNLADSPEDFAASVPGVLDEAPPRTGMTVGSKVDVPGLGKFLVTEQLESAKEAQLKMDSTVEGYTMQHPSALDVQVGGAHYKTFAIQPVEFIHRNGIPFIEGNAIKYLCRWREKGGVEDLKKVKHYIDLLIEMESKK